MKDADGIRIALSMYDDGFKAGVEKVLEILDEMESSPEYTKVADGKYIGSILTNTGKVREKINEL